MTKCYNIRGLKKNFRQGIIKSRKLQQPNSAKGLVPLNLSDFKVFDYIVILKEGLAQNG